MTLDAVVFVVSAVIAVFGATMMIAQRNTVASVLYLILSLGAQAVLYVQLGALFLGAILIIVYAGAILVLFLFVIMLLNLRGGLDLGGRPPAVSRSAKYLVSFILLLELVYIIRKGFQEAAPTGVANLAPDGFGSVTEVATRLFREYVYPFELTGVLLLVAVVGAVVIAKKESPEEDTAGSDPGEDVVSNHSTDKVGE
jgi:NADH-quinone oxidoreductase subunit J